MSKKKPKPEFDPALVELLAKAMDGHAFIRYKEGDVLPRGEEMSTPEAVNKVQVWRQRSAESKARQALRALRTSNMDPHELRNVIEIFLKFLASLPVGWLRNLTGDVGLLNDAYVAAGKLGITIPPKTS